jgi:hypothetical protein
LIAYNTSRRCVGDLEMSYAPRIDPITTFACMFLYNPFPLFTIFRMLLGLVE